LPTIWGLCSTGQRSRRERTRIKQRAETGSVSLRLVKG